jgi:hypothetical protein
MIHNIFALALLRVGDEVLLIKAVRMSILVKDYMAWWEAR